VILLREGNSKLRAKTTDDGDQPEQSTHQRQKKLRFDIGGIGNRLGRQQGRRPTDEIERGHRIDSPATKTENEEHAGSRLLQIRDLIARSAARERKSSRDDRARRTPDANPRHGARTKNTKVAGAEAYSRGEASQPRMRPGNQRRLRP
jgi:hypothetical protein